MKSFSALVMVAFTCACARSGTQTAAGGATNEVRDDCNGTNSQLSGNPEIYLISQSGIGRIRLDMTLDEARRALPVARFARTSDGDGAALVEVVLAPDESMILWTGEEEPNAAIDWSQRIETIETFSPAFHTAEDIRPGSLVSDVEPVFGRTKQIEKSEIESRQYIVFEAQPAYLTFRLDDSGIFSDRIRTTTEVQAGARILSIAVSSYGPDKGTVSPPGARAP